MMGGFALDNQSSLNVDASFNYWGATSESGVQAQINGVATVDYTPWLNAASDILLGYGNYTTLYVGAGGWQDTTAAPSGRINEAIGGLADGASHTITVYGADLSLVGATGVYVEQVVIAKNLTLQGTSQSGTIIQSPASVPANFITAYNGVENHPVVFVNGAANVAIKTLTVDGNGQGNGTPGNYRFEGIGYFNAGGTIDHVTIEHIRETPLNGDQQGIGIFAESEAGTNSLNITNDTIFDYQKGGIVVNGTGLTALVSGNTVTGIATSLTAQNGIQISRGAVANVTGNTVDGNSFTSAASPDDYAAGILLYQAGTGTQVTANTIGATTGADAGIFVDGNGGARRSAKTLSKTAPMPAFTLPTTWADRPSATTLSRTTGPAS